VPPHLWCEKYQESLREHIKKDFSPTIDTFGSANFYINAQPITPYQLLISKVEM
jgi:hypothetical protein